MSLSPILYVEDEESDVVLTRLAFERLGVFNPLHSVRTGRIAIDYLAGHGIYADRQQHPFPSLVLLDLNLPFKSGLDVLQWIRAQEQFRSLPVVVYTSSEKKSDINRARELGADEYYVKSIYLAETDSVIQTIRDRWLMPEACRSIQ